MAASTDEGFRADRAGARKPAPARRRTPRHEIRALLRAHLAAATGYRHLTRHCAVCARLLRLAMEPAPASPAAEPATESPERAAESPKEPPTPSEPPAGPGRPSRGRW